MRSSYPDWAIEGSDNTRPLVGELLTRFGKTYEPARRPVPAFIVALEATLAALILNLGRLCLLGYHSSLSISMRKEWYASNRDWIGDTVTLRSVETCIQFLFDQGLITYRAGRASGTKSFQRATCISPSRQFLRLMRDSSLKLFDVSSSPTANLVRLREPKSAKRKGAFIPFEETWETGFMRDNLAFINTVLLRHWPDLEITESQWNEMGAYIASKRDRSPVDLTRRTLYRTFNNGTFEDGGRLYGGWWQDVPRAYRPYITLDGKQTVEVDYSAMHPTILYAEAGVSMPDDPYVFGGFDRDVVKLTFNALINAKGTSIKPVAGFQESAFGCSWKEFLAEVKGQFGGLRHYFGTGHGLKLQRLDSDIAEEVMLEFAASNIPILPVHDSFLVHHGHEDLLKQRMEKSFLRRVGVPVRLKTVVLDPRVRANMRSNEEVTDDLERLLQYTGPYADYDRRYDAWFARRAEGLSSVGAGAPRLPLNTMFESA